MKKIAMIVFFAIMLGLGFAYYQWNKPKKSAASEEVFARRSATDLYVEFTSDPSGAFQIYNQKNVEVRGIMDAFAKDSSGIKLTFKTDSDDGGIVTITLTDDMLDFSPVIGDSVHVRGLCAGYIADDTGLLGGEVQLNQGVLVQH
jgi:hypothetical protein